MYPKLKFKTSYKKDIQAFKGFSKDAEFDNGRNLEWAVFKHYPTLKKIKDNSQIEKFIQKTHKQNQDVMLRNLKKYRENWKNMEKEFYNLVEQLFPSKYWSKGKYIAYLTIWGMYPRFLDDKTFMIPYKHQSEKYVNVVIAHEILHFIFYNYFFEKYSQYQKDEYNFFVWNVSEIFNELIQNSSEWTGVFKEKMMGYPEHEKIVKEIKKKYRDNWDIDGFIEDIIRMVKK